MLQGTGDSGSLDRPLGQRPDVDLVVRLAQPEVTFAVDELCAGIALEPR